MGRPLSLRPVKEWFECPNASGFRENGASIMAETIEARNSLAKHASSVPYNSVCAPSTPSSSSPSALSSLYVTFKVLQLVNAFRKRVKTRVQSSKEDLVTVQQDFCQAFERQAYAEIDRRLGRKRAFPGLTCRRNPLGNHKRDFAVPHTNTTNLTTRPETRVARRIDWLLNEIDTAVTCHEHEESLVTVAKSHTLFLTRCAEIQSRRLSLKQLAQLIVIVKDLLVTLNQVVIVTPRPKCLARGTEIIDPAIHDYWLDETQLANLYHLLLCLQDPLLRQLVARCLELVRKHVAECQRDHSKRYTAWFSEFPGAQHPLSTTWPWSIKPSLAILWGVCWMFYDYSNHTFDAEGNMLDAQGSIVVPQRVVQQYLSAVQRERQRQGQAQNAGTSDISSLLALREVGGRSIGLTDPVPEFRPGRNRLSPTAAPQQAPMAPSSRMASRSPNGTQQSQQQQQHQQHQQQLLPLQQRTHRARSVAAHESWADSVDSGEYLPVPPTAVYQAGTSGDLHVSPDFQARLAVSGTNNASFAGGGVPAAPSAYVDSGAPATLQHTPRHFLPEESFASGLGYPPSSATPYHNSTDAVASSNSTAWSLSQSVPEPPPRSFYEQQSQPLPRRTRAQVTPLIRITTDLAAQAASFASQPQDTIYSASSNSSLPHTEYGYNTTNYTSSGHLSPRGPSTYMPQESDMQTPPRSPLAALGDTAMGDAQAQQVSRKRSHSIMSQADHHSASAHHSPAGSVLSNRAVSPADESSPRSSRAVKRGDPPVNNENKYVCDFADECRGMVFDRKCEWSKHMDKHDRPYRCPDPACAKLQGFTYSGGLLRHEREVHGKHGGPKAQLMCPVEDCKRHMGKGFTRKENLNEHLRRVHSFKDQQHQPSQGLAFRRDTQDSMVSVEEAAAAAAAAATPASRVSEAADFDEHSMISPGLGKRKRSLAGASERATSEEVEDLKQELKRLRSEAERKDERIRQMEEERQAQGQKIHGLEEAVLRLQQLMPQHQ